MANGRLEGGVVTGDALARLEPTGELAGGIRLVATDLDGTLLAGYRKDVPPEAWPAIERVCDRGHSSLRRVAGSTRASATSSFR
ncbi:hypothetical protein [Olsenella uli]|uniref:hypothetical protein n=1 Tax=Olsenella uli TaxID=133926 RepID=UPI0012AB3418|nr:hypothetical protein [Olsenella uli]